jgi:hypothetical protein
VTPSAPVRLTERDYVILNHVSVHRYLRSKHVLALVKGSSQHLIRRLGRLYHSGFLERPPRQRLQDPDQNHLSYCLSRRGRRELIQRGERVHAGPPRIRRHSTGSHLGHDLRVADVVVSIQAIAGRQGISFVHHHDWPTFSPESVTLKTIKWSVRLKGDSRRFTSWIIPDAAFSLRFDDREVFFLLEVDRGTMPVARRDPSQSSFVKKVEAYRETRKAGQLWRRWQIPGFRILVIAESRKRLKSLQEGTAKCFQRGASTMFLFTLASDLEGAADPFCEIWEDCAGRSVDLVPKQATQTDPCQSPPTVAT